MTKVVHLFNPQIYSINIYGGYRKLLLSFTGSVNSLETTAAWKSSALKLKID